MTGSADQPTPRVASHLDDFEAWYRAEHPKVISALACVTGEREAAAEAADEAFTRALERWARVRLMDSPGGWTHRVALNAVRRTLRRRGMEARAREQLAPGPPPSPAWSAEVWDAISRLPARQRTAVALVYVSDLPQADAAHAMGVTVGTVAATLHAAREQLAHLLAEPTSGGTR